LLRHRSIADDVLADRMLDVLNVTPVFWISVLQPNKRSADVWWTVLGVVHDNRLFAPGRHEDLDGFVVIAEAALIERALDASSTSTTWPTLKRTQTAARAMAFRFRRSFAARARRRAH
jgi:hypothetical protein